MTQTGHARLSPNDVEPVYRLELLLYVSLLTGGTDVTYLLRKRVAADVLKGIVTIELLVACFAVMTFSYFSTANPLYRLVRLIPAFGTGHDSTCCTSERGGAKTQ